MCEPLALKRELYISGGGQLHMLPLLPPAASAEGFGGQAGYVLGVPAQETALHPVPPSALVAGRKYHRDPTPIRARSRTAAVNDA